MALRVAELLRRTEGTADALAKEGVERECQDLITRLWESRESWPSGGPLGSILPTLKVLLAGEPDYRSWRSRPDENQAIGLITNLLQLQRKELQHFCLAIHDRIPASTMEAMRLLLAEHENALSEEEANVLYFVTNPSRLPLFNNVEEVEVDEGEPKEETKLASTTEPVDRLAECLAFITKERQQFFARVASTNNLS